MIQVVVADDHAVVREGMKRIIEGAGDMSVAAEAADGEMLLRRVAAVPCDVVVMDLAMPGMSGLEVLRELRRRQPRLPVLILTMHPADQYAVRTLREGAAGFLHKGDSPGELVEAIRTVVGGQRYISRPVAESLASHVDATREAVPHERLSNREFQVLRLIASGKRLSEIAVELSLSIKTVSTFRRRLLEKLGLTRNAELVRYALEHGIVD
ncbi:MAG TPA: response regulator transcription factor [Phycisphaerae bacterium]|nr:response regulator transcription factor [Phycisphaerae bacterium]HNU46863.1 response regulator transcription factor [Phycisphaerae bacterium]